MSFDAAAFIREQTTLMAPTIVPELKLQLATEVTPLWQLSEERLQGGNLPPPFWAFAWPGGQGLARYILDHPEVVRGKRMIDYAAGSGIAGIAAMQAGAFSATAVDIDPLALAAIGMNAAHNQVTVKTEASLDLRKPPKQTDLIVAGDICYEQAMAARLMRWLWISKAQGIRVLLADPGRAYLPQDGLKELARYTVPTSRDIEDRDSRDVVVAEVFVPAVA